MNNQMKAKVVSCALVAGSIGWYIHARSVMYSAMGQAAFIEAQLKRFDRHLEHPISLVYYVLAMMLLFGGLILIYEGLALGTYRLLEHRRQKDRTSQPLD